MRLAERNIQLGSHLFALRPVVQINANPWLKFNRCSDFIIFALPFFFKIPETKNYYNKQALAKFLLNFKLTKD